MGLDSYWRKPGESKSAPLDFDPPLCIEDEHDRQYRVDGWAHLRSRNFSDLIEQITGVSLHSDCLDNITVRRMADSLTKFAAKPWKLPPADSSAGWQHLASDDYITDVVRDLARLFKAYGEAGYELHGSW